MTSYTNLTGIPLRVEIYRMWKMNTVYYIKAIKSHRITDIQTDTTEIIYHDASQVVRN